MSKLIKEKVHFAPGAQRAIVEKVLSHSKMSVAEMAAILYITPRTLRDWRREKHRMSYVGLKKMCKHAHIPLPTNLDVRDAYSHTREAGILGSAAVKKKYGKNFPCDPKYRQKQWEKWWENEGKHNPPPQRQPLAIHKPKPSNNLAEFIGILIGDGGITKHQVTITLNRTDDLEYAHYVQMLCVKLFKLQPGVYHRADNNVVNIVISRTALVSYLESLGLKKGDKIRNKVTIPDWILQNHKYLQRCLRGLFDTDGGLFLETHTIKQKEYSYIRLAFVSASKPLIRAIYDSLNKYNFHPKVRSGKRVQLEKKDEILRYFKDIGTSNPKHENRLKKICRKYNKMIKYSPQIDREGWQRGRMHWF